MPNLNSLKIKIFGDGADLGNIRALYSQPCFTDQTRAVRSASISVVSGVHSNACEVPFMPTFIFMIWKCEI